MESTPDMARIRNLAVVTEVLDAIPENDSVIRIQRREELLLTPPPAAAMRFWRDYDLLAVAHFSPTYTPMKFAPPRDVFASDVFRLEWQQMKSRQPFYHRNGDVDELSYQVSGDRTLMTELGSVELRPGDFSRIPVGVAHDNYGREEVHLLFYVLAPAVECGSVAAESEHKKVPFEGWSPACKVEMMTECLGAIGCDIAVSMVDEELLLDENNSVARDRDGEKIVVQRATNLGSPEQEQEEAEDEAQWMYKSKNVWIGAVHLRKAQGKTYRRHRRAHAVHCQISGSRTLVTQRGTAKMEPGDFICIPRGCAYTSIAAEESLHIVIIFASDELVMKAPVARTAETTTMELVEATRAGI